MDALIDKYNQLMQNKSGAAKSLYIRPCTYRSVRYNVTHSSFHPSSTSFIQQTTASPIRQPPKTYASTCRKPYSTHHNTPSTTTQATYLQTWHKLLSQQDKGRGEGANEERGEGKGEGMRVQLPSIIDFEPSNFTSLDPLFLPFEHIQKGIEEVKQELPQPRVEMAQMRHEMAHLRRRIEGELQESARLGGEGLERLRRMLARDRVEWQEVQLRFKRQCQSLKEMDGELRQSFESTKPPLDDLQDQIFSCRPFELKSNPLLHQHFPQTYF